MESEHRFVVISQEGEGNVSELVYLAEFPFGVTKVFGIEDVVLYNTENVLNASELITFTLLIVMCISPQ